MPPIGNDGLGDDGFAAPSLPDNLKDAGVPYDLDDDVEISLIGDDDDGAILEPRRGQNEDPAQNQRAAAGEDDDIEDPRVKERIQRERRLRMENERASQEALEKAEKTILAERKSNIRAQKDAFAISLDAVDVRLSTAREGLLAAADEGDRRAEMQLQEQIRKLETIRTNIESNMAKLPTEDQLDRAYQEHVSARRSRVQQTPSRSNDDLRPLNEKAGRWAQQNAWMNEPGRVSEKAALGAIDRALVAEGYDPRDDEYFIEMSKRMAKDFPSLGVKTLDGRTLGGAPANRQAASRASAPPVASARSVAPPSPSSRGKPRVELDQTDRRMMRTLGIDLANKEAVKRFAKEKLMRLRNESARG